MIITGFEKRGRRVLVRFDDGSSLLLNYEIFMKNGLRINNDLSESRLDLLRNENLKHEIKQTAFNLLARRLHSSSELRTKLRLKYHHTEFIEEILTHLSENKYLDDDKFAADFIEEKSKSKLWGSNKIKAELSRRGIKNKSIDKEFIESHLDNNAETLRIAAEKKYNILQKRNLPEDKLRQKLITYLLGKGFDYEDIKVQVNLLIRQRLSF
jgi:regulatory protein